MKIRQDVFSFEWDKGNIDKNKKHNVDNSEAEEVFFDRNKVTLKDKKHSGIENRYILLGRTKKKRLLYIIFTKRGKKVRIISARNINKREVILYEKAA